MSDNNGLFNYEQSTSNPRRVKPVSAFDHQKPKVNARVVPVDDTLYKTKTSIIKFAELVDIKNNTLKYYALISNIKIDLVIILDPMCTGDINIYNICDKIVENLGLDTGEIMDKDIIRFTLTNELFRVLLQYGKNSTVESDISFLDNCALIDTIVDKITKILQ